MIGSVNYGERHIKIPVISSYYLKVNTCHMVGPIPVVRVCSHTHLITRLGRHINIVLEILERDHVISNLEEF